MSTIGALGDILDATLELLQLTDRQHARLRMFIDLERGVAREMRASRRGSRASTRVVLGGCWAGCWGGLGRRHRFDVDGGERRREVEQRHDFDVLLFEAARGAAGKMCRAAARRTLEVHVCDSCALSALSIPLSSGFPGACLSRAQTTHVLVSTAHSKGNVAIAAARACIRVLVGVGVFVSHQRRGLARPLARAKAPHC